MFIKKGTSSVQQMAYAKRILGAKGQTKKDIALDVGYSTNVAKSAASHIEKTAGFNNAMAKLAVDSNNLALAAMHEFKSRGFKEFSDKNLIGALNAIGSAWNKFNALPKEKETSQVGNKLRTIVLQQVENQTVMPDVKEVEKSETPKPEPKPVEAEFEEVVAEGIEEVYDF